MNLAELTEVWTIPSAILAIVAGVAYGLLVGWIATNPAYSSGIAGPIRSAIIATVFAASGGLIFFAFQTLGSYYSNDPHFTRVMSRYGQWLLFSVTIGVTTWALVQRDLRRRRRRARDQVSTEGPG